MTGTKITKKTEREEDAWDLLDPDRILEVGNVSSFLYFLESESLNDLHIADSDGVSMTLIALAEENKMVIYRTSLVVLKKDHKERIMKVVGNPHSPLNTAHRHGMKRILGAYLGNPS